MSRGTFLLSKLSVLGNRQAEAMGLLVSKGLSSITDAQADFLEQVLELLKRHQTRTQRDLAMEIVRSIAKSSDPPIHILHRGAEDRITVSNSKVDISTNANVKLRWNYDGRELDSTATATVGNVYSSELQIQDLELYHGNFYKLDVTYEDGTNRFVVTHLYVIVESSVGVDAALLTAPTHVSAVTDGGGEFTTFTWTNPTHKDFRFAQLRTSDGLILYRGNGTTYVWHHDKTGSETFSYFSEGPGGHVVESETVTVSGLAISTTNVVTGGTNLLALVTGNATSIDTTRNITFLQGAPVRECYEFGEADVRVDDGDIGNSLVIASGEWPLATANYATVDAYAYQFKLEVDDCNGNCVFVSTDFVQFGYAILLLIPANDLGWSTPGTSYQYRIIVTDTTGATQQVISGCWLKVACPEVPEDVPPNDHYVETVAVTSAVSAATSSSDCGCG